MVAKWEKCPISQWVDNKYSEHEFTNMLYLYISPNEHTTPVQPVAKAATNSNWKITQEGRDEIKLRLERTNEATTTTTKTTTTEITTTITIEIITTTEITTLTTTGKKRKKKDQQQQNRTTIVTLFRLGF